MFYSIGSPAGKHRNSTNKKTEADVLYYNSNFLCINYKLVLDSAEVTEVRITQILQKAS